MKLTTLLFFFVFALTITVNGQIDWSKMSANQKIKLAKKEQKAAKKDPEYLKMMDEALALFQEGKFEESKNLYTAAHNRRPDNVYPMVMLDDISVAMTLPVEEVVVEEIILDETSVEEIAPEIEIIEEVEVVEEVKIIEEEEVEEIAIDNRAIVVPVDTEIKIEKEKKEVVNNEKVVIAHPVKVYEEDGIYKEELKEGSATITQVTIVEKGVAVVFRKVSHSWGAIYFFQNDDPITRAEWDKMQDKIAED